MSRKGQGPKAAKKVKKALRTRAKINRIVKENKIQELYVPEVSKKAQKRLDYDTNLDAGIKAAIAQYGPSKAPMHEFNPLFSWGAKGGPDKRKKQGTARSRRGPGGPNPNYREV